MKKILFVSHTANFSKFNRIFMQWFRDRGWEVHYASDGKEQIANCDKSYTLSFTRFPITGKNFGAFRELKSIIEKEEYNIIHCHTPVGGVLARLAARKTRKEGTKVIYTGHGLHFYKGAPLQNWLLYYPIEKICAKYTDCLITINEEDFQNVKKHHFKAGCIEKVHGVGVDLNRFHKPTEEEKKRLRMEYGYDENAPIIICVAEINKNKNQIFLIEALSELKQIYPNIQLLLVGTGTKEDELKSFVKKEQLESHIVFCGYRNDVEKLYALSDILVTASYREGLPVNILEAMASGLPVLCTDVRGQRDLVRNERNGFLYIADDKKRFCEKLCELIQNKELRETIGLYNLQDVERYSKDEVLKEMAKIYERYM